jgi:hypothetical protein
VKLQGQQHPSLQSTKCVLRLERTRNLPRDPYMLQDVNNVGKNRWPKRWKFPSGLEWRWCQWMNNYFCYWQQSSSTKTSWSGSSMQLYVILVKNGDLIVPVVFALLQIKTQLVVYHTSKWEVPISNAKWACSVCVVDTLTARSTLLHYFAQWNTMLSLFDNINFM